MTRASAKIPVRLTRRELVRGAGGLLVALAGCRGTPRPETPATRAEPAPGTPRGAAVEGPGAAAAREQARARRLRDLRGPVALHAFFDLPEADPRSHELSGIAWDDATRTLYAVQDENARIVSLVPDAELRTWTIEGALQLQVGEESDLEGIVALPNGFFVCTEIGPHIFEVDRKGNVVRELPLPPHYRTARRNKSLESLSMSPSGRYLFTTSEAALGCDGLLATVTVGTSVRVLRIDLQTMDVVEHVYVTDPVPQKDTEHGVSELLALSDDELLVLERGFTKGIGNTARIYRTRLATSAVCTTAEHVDDASSALPKQLFVDLGLLASRVPPPSKQPQSSPLLDNFEGMAIGPELPDGRATILVVSDDNGRKQQVARLLVLAVG